MKQIFRLAHLSAYILGWTLALDSKFLGCYLYIVESHWQYVLYHVLVHGSFPLLTSGEDLIQSIAGEYEAGAMLYQCLIGRWFGGLLYIVLHSLMEEQQAINIIIELNYTSQTVSSPAVRRKSVNCTNTQPENSIS